MNYRSSLIFYSASCLLIGCFAGVLFYLGTHRLVDLTALERYSPGRPSIVIDDQGNEIMRFQFERRDPVSLSEMPKQLINAFVSAEDHTFFTHYGISPRSIARSVFVNIIQGRKAQGASTITQQLVRHLFYSLEKSFTRKIKEQLLALYIEWRFTKEQILETYLNHIYFGEGVYGVQAAAQRFWNMPVRDLSPAQCATLAGVIRNPGFYCPLIHPKNSIARRNLILKLMFDQGYLDRVAYETAVKEPLQLQSHKDKRAASYVREMIRQYAEEQISHEDLYTGGYVIQTTLNRAAQEHAEHVFNKHLNTLKTAVPQVDGALVCIETGTGAIKALVGGFDFNNSQYNRATQAKRQMGSMFKPVIYTEAIKNGHRFSDTLVDEKISIDGWEPQNVNERYEGQMSLARALSVSNNILSVKLLLEQGVDRIINCAKQFHLPGPFPPYPSLALGCTDCAPIDAVGMINVFANKGVYVEPHLITWIKDRWGNKVIRTRPVVERIIDWQTSSQVARALQLVTENAQRKLPQWPLKGQSLGKTGTTNENRSCWFAGATPTHSTVVYLGCDDNSPMEGRIASSYHAIPLWLEFNTLIENPAATFIFEPTLTRISINPKTGYVSSGSDALSILVPATP